MIANDKHQCTIHFLCISEIDCVNICISHVIAMCHDARNHFKHGSNCTKLLFLIYQFLQCKENELCVDIYHE